MSPLAVMYGYLVVMSLADVVGANARKLRLDAGATLEQMAQSARLWGLPWSSGRVGDFENGRIPPNLLTIYAAIHALQAITGMPVTLADLLAGDDTVEINDTVTADLAELRAWLASPKRKRVRYSATKSHSGAITLEIEPSDDLPVEALREADYRLAKNMGYRPEMVAAVMAKLWKKPFTAERDERAGPDANPQRKGIISRQLKAELEEAIRDGNG